MSILLGFFCLFFQFMTNSVRGIYLKNGSNQQQHHPFSHDINNVCVQTIGDMVLEKRQQEIIGILHHEQPCQDEQDIGEDHDATQTTDHEAVAIVCLQYLHGRKQNGAYKENPGCGMTESEHIEAGTDDHHGTAYQEQDVLEPIQLSHHLPPLPVVNHHSVRRYPHRRPS